MEESLNSRNSTASNSQYADDNVKIEESKTAVNLSMAKLQRTDPESNAADIDQMRSEVSFLLSRLVKLFEVRSVGNQENQKLKICRGESAPSDQSGSRITFASADNEQDSWSANFDNGQKESEMRVQVWNLLDKSCFSSLVTESIVSQILEMLKTKMLQLEVELSSLLGVKIPSNSTGINSLDSSDTALNGYFNNEIDSDETEDSADDSQDYSIKEEVMDNSTSENYETEQHFSSQDVKSCEDTTSIHAKKKIHVCAVCEKIFPSKSELQRHLRTHTGERPFNCTTCGKSFADRSNLRSHAKTHTAEKPYKCSTCGKEFARSSNLIGHLRCHTGERPYSCSICGMNYPFNYSLQIHMKTHRGQRDFKCSLCGKAFYEKASLKRHTKIHSIGIRHGIRLGEPDECGVMRDGGESNETFSDCPSVEKDDVDDDDDDRLHGGLSQVVCMVCGESFSDKSNLQIHLKTHTIENPDLYYSLQKDDILIKAELNQHLCPSCGKSFFDKSRLQDHLKTHMTEKPYKCQECGMSFVYNGGLQRHLRTHTGEKPFKCTTCGKAFADHSNLRSHARTHSEEKPYICDTCGKKFSRSSNLTIHVRTHTGEKPFQCSVCGMSFSYNYGLQKHMTNHS